MPAATPTQTPRASGHTPHARGIARAAPASAVRLPPRCARASGPPPRCCPGPRLRAGCPGPARAVADSESGKSEWVSDKWDDEWENTEEWEEDEDEDEQTGMQFAGLAPPPMLVPEEDEWEGALDVEAAVDKVQDEDGALALVYDISEDDDWDDEEIIEDFIADYDEDKDKSNPPARGLPPEMRFFDTAKLCIKAGDGGDGCVSFRREKHVPYGGPNGGNGGDGGNVIVVANVNRGMSSLKHFRQKIHHRATRGQHGGGDKKEGKCGKDVVIEVPVGTIIRDAETREFMCELLEAGERYVLLEGGTGGRGNTAFARGNNRAPVIAQVGEEGPEKWVELELKLVADVGIVGVPNAGKSTLLAAVTNAKPKIADYPFTTIVPNLGVYEQDFQSIVIADIPGILEGAHDGLGLGQEFLRHCERTRILIHLIDGSGDDPMGDYDAINMELMLFNETLCNKPQVVVVNKMDTPEAQERWPELQAEFMKRGVPVSQISGYTTEGVRDMMRLVGQVLQDIPEPESGVPETALATRVKKKKPRTKERFEEFEVSSDPVTGLYYLKGDGLEKFAQMTNWDFYESITRFQTVLKACGATKALEEAGIQAGDTVVIGKYALEWSNQTNTDILDTFNTSDGLSKGSRHWPQPGR